MTRDWEVALDELEASMNRAEHMLQTSDPSEVVACWEPPTVGAIPRYLMPRAQALLERQQQLIDRLPVAMSSNRQQRALADRVGRATTRGTQPVYLDVTA